MHVDGNLRMYKLDSDPSDRRDSSSTSTPHMLRASNDPNHRVHMTQPPAAQRQAHPIPQVAHRTPQHNVSPRHSLSSQHSSNSMRSTANSGSPQRSVDSFHNSTSRASMDSRQRVSEHGNYRHLSPDRGGMVQL